MKLKVFRLSIGLSRDKRRYRPSHGPQVWPWWRLAVVSPVRHEAGQPSWNVWLYTRWGAWCWEFAAKWTKPVWVLVQYPESEPWEIAGIYSSEERANAECRKGMGVGSIVLNEPAVLGSVSWDVKFPKG